MCSCGNDSYQNKGSQEAKAKHASWRSFGECWPTLAPQGCGKWSLMHCGRRNTQKRRKMGRSSKGTRPATNVGSVTFICALAFLVKVALWIITPKLFTGHELGCYSINVFLSWNKDCGYFVFKTTATLFLSKDSFFKGFCSKLQPFYNILDGAWWLHMNYHFLLIVVNV